MSLINKEEIGSFQPTNGAVFVVVREEESKKSKIGVIMPPSGENDARRGEVIAVSIHGYKDKESNVVDLKIGDHILFKKWSGIEINHDQKEKIFSVNFTDVFGIGGKI